MHLMFMYLMYLTPCVHVSHSYVAAGVNPENLPFRNFERRELMSRFNLSLSLLEAGGGGSGLKAIRNAHKLSKLAQARYLVSTPV